MAKKKAMTEGERWVLAHLGGRKVSLDALRTKGMFRMARGAAKSLDRLVNKVAWAGFSEGIWIGEYTVNSYNGRTAIQAMEAKYGPRPTPKRAKK